ncbi:response regulator [Brevundimonas diminuta]|uniref:histidine kinase n=3 Tax=Pseudomonadota TaxID=1224 RepID=A0A410NSF2_BREDI|nr:PAS-domain containing protein [Brevundimonas diminuta]MBD3573586.1 response regulator [Brevundimonas diminuta]QAT12873.1 response regulator [Brevundimonas diminuta]QQB89778.1 PAS-domain containing protein [Brevundimonas diminuta]GEC01867.1 hybrid sensor histidine kinase/response regulator [Brevundimonas diminuta]
MFSLATLALTAFYMAALFGIAWWYERPQIKARRGMLGPSLYALSLAIYCTSWTYYGAVGTAARDGWEYLPIYVGPILGLTLLLPLWRRIASAARRENVGSMADFISSRYGKSPALGAAVAGVAILGSVPYIALQLKSLSMAGEMITAGTPVAGSESLTVLVMAAVLAGFAILFGARRPDLTEHNRGLIQAIGIESIVKLAALLAVAVFAVALLAASPSRQAAADSLGQLGTWPHIDARFMAITLVATLAIFCLPRQFHVAFVEGGDPAQVRRARWIFPLYLILTTLAVLPLVAAGGLFRPETNPDLLVLALPFGAGQSLLTAVVFVGGFSAATAMVIVEAVALSAMVSNNLVLPLMGAGRRRGAAQPDMARALLNIRRLAIVALLLLAWLYYLAMDRSSGLAAIGLVSFAALAQLAPSLFGAVLWRGGRASGALAGLAAGMTVWAVMLAAPQLAPGFGLNVPAMLGLEDPFAAGVFLSLTLNLGVFVLVSRARPPRLIDRVQARAFVDRLGPDWLEGRGGSAGASVGDLRALVARFIGDERAERAFAAWARETDVRLKDADPADAALARAAERMLAGAVGAAAARRVLAAALAAGGRAPEDVVRMLDEASQAVQFNRDLLQTTLDNIDQGVSVVDEDLRLTAWNRRYVEMFGLPAGFVHVGLPVAAVYRLNAERGEAGVPDHEIDAWVERRLEALARRIPHDHEREQPDGRILRSSGAPIPGGGYATSYTDITALRRAARELEEANERLEARVADRTERLEEARRQAEDATASKTRFLAAASHDLLQPLHAARLFIAALREDADLAGSPARGLATNADRAIDSAHRLLTALLNLSKLEAGGVQPAVAPLALGGLFDELAREFAPVARAKGLTLTVAPSSLWIASDRDLLRSMLQNLIANAIRYTDRGRVLIGARRDGERVQILVSDTGRGIAEADRQAVFGEFVRLPGAPVDEPGAGLGLAIVQKLSDLLRHPLSLASRVGRGTTFRVAVPRAAARPEPEIMSDDRRLPLAGLRVLCVDNEPAILDALTALLDRWGAQAVTARSVAEARAADGPFDAALVDLHLGDDEPDGLAAVDALRAQGVRRIALVTADTRDGLKEKAAAAGAVLLPKPVKPAALKAFLRS